MTAISTRAHEKFMELLDQRTVMETLDEEFCHDSRLLCDLYGRYREHLSALRRLIARYEIVQKRLRAELRKQSMAAGRQTRCL
ncbi:MAG: hypothetical protein ABW019_12600 [Chitinophagaceae bacterium]